jgi:hypothetical protein
LDNLISPHGGRLIDLLVGEERIAENREKSRDWQPAEATREVLLHLERQGYFSARDEG